MAEEKKSNVNNIINIKFRPMQCQSHVGAFKCVNDDWGTIAFYIPRNQIQTKFADQELRYNFIYFLFGYDDCKEVVYVGQAKKRNNGESVLARLREHDDSTTEKYRDKWNCAIAVTNKDDAWGLDDLNALEYAFCKEIPVEQSLNGNNPNSGGANYNEYIDKINQIKSFITAFGFTMFSDEATTEEIQVLSEESTSTIVEDLQNGMARIPEIITPHKIVKVMVDMLPSDVWNSHTTFLDPACKGGEYLREVYDRLMDCESLQLEFPDRVERSHHILKNQIFGIALSQVSLGRTTKKLFNEDKNIRVIPGYMRLLRTRFDPEMKAEDKYNYVMDKLKKEFGREDMHFDVVIGNPPYQEETASIYQHFINLGMTISDIVCMITKSNWLTSDTLSSTRESMIEFGLKKITSYPVMNELFKGIATQVSIFYMQKGYQGEVSFSEIRNGKITSEYSAKLNSDDIIFSDKIEYNIASKIDTSKYNFGERTYPEEAFGIATNGTVGRGKNAYLLEDQRTKDTEHNIAVVYMNSSKLPYITWISYDDIPRCKEIANKYKLICGRILLNNQSVITNIHVINPMTVCTTSWGVLYATDNKDEIYNIYKYIKTRFVRFLISIMCSEGVNGVSSYRFSKVPLLDFVSNSDVDWSKSVENIDKQLYKKYKLSGEEIEYIEKMIKPME